MNTVEKSAGKVVMPTKAASVNRNNNFGLLRLLLALLVILSHSPELIDGNRSREILTRIFGTISFGDLAVDGFFLISGYLIIASYVRSKSRFDYLAKRILRIYPGFIVACLFSFAVGMLGGGRFTGPNAIPLVKHLDYLIVLRQPELYGAFHGLPHPVINGAMWTINYEFRCYLLVIALGALGLLRNRRAFLTATIIFLAATTIKIDHPLRGAVAQFTGQIPETIRFTGIFLCGGAFFLFKEEIRYRKDFCLIAAGCLIPLMFNSRLAGPALTVFGGYLLFWFAFKVRLGVLSRLDHHFDLSYGIYLYAWPVQTLIIWRFRHISPWILTAEALPIVALLAFASWTFVERPCLDLKGALPSNLDTLKFWPWQSSRLQPKSQLRGVEEGELGGVVVPQD